MSAHEPDNVERLDNSTAEDDLVSPGPLLSIPDIDDETESTRSQEKAKELETEDFDPEKLQEQTRTQLATHLVLILAWTLVGIAAYLFIPTLTNSVLSIVKAVKESPQSSKANPETVTQPPVVEVKKDKHLVIFLKENNPTAKEDKPNGESKELITLIWTSQVTLVSGALGFYFGSKK